MAEAISVSGQVSGSDKVITFETGKLAGLADGAVTAKIDGTVVLVTAAAGSAREGADFFPLTVDIEERMYAAGRIPGSFFRREGRASEDAILTCRLIDRPLRHSFPSGYRNDTHVVGTILGVDGENPYDVIALNGASAALTLSGIPFEGPIGAVRIAYSTDGTWIPHPTHEESTDSTFEMVVAGRLLEDGDVAVMMVEAGGTEKSFAYYADGAPKVDEDVLSDGLQACKVWIKEVIGLQTQLVIAAGVAAPISWSPVVDYSDDVYARVEATAANDVAAAMIIADKTERDAASAAIKDRVRAELAEEFAELSDGSKQIGNALRSLTKNIVRERVIKEGVRIDGRGTSDLRPLSSEVAILKTAHGSGLFQRGETQVLNVTTLGMLRMEQIVDTLNPSNRKRYMHHYNFPPFSTGEAGFMRGPKRREIGHGALAERALLPVIPPKEDFPYVLRLVSDVLSSNGSTSMASVCSSSLSLMDAGVPIIAPVAGIAMGLIYDGNNYIPLTDILGAEDAMGDMDFKVAGTADAITALQLDTKIDGIPADVLTTALGQAKDARMAILDDMSNAIAAPREDVGEAAPKIVSFEIPMDKIGEVIGPRGKVINTIQEETGADIAVDDDGAVGTVSVGSVDRAKVDEA
ncbi:MAG: polyribonucleotide nucleotidyltransferase, partial [Acidimicrobiales bacterium]